MKNQKVNTLKLSDAAYPKVLRDIASPPSHLYYLGVAPGLWLSKPKVAIVGSRKMSSYGEQVTTQLASGLARAGVVIISGLALGVDAAAHRAALQAGGTAVAVLPTPLYQIHPVSNEQLARQIIDTGGTLISEYDSALPVQKFNFVERNRIVSGLADALLITEAALKSGSLHTARFALEQGKTVMAVPGNITSPGSEGCNNLIKSGALPMTNIDDILFELGISLQKAKQARVFRGSHSEQRILELIASGVRSQEDLAIAASFAGADVNSALTVLEIEGFIRPAGAGNWTLA